MTLEIIDPGHRLRSAAEGHIRAVFQTRYGALVRTMPALLVGECEADGGLGCVAGVRFGPSAWFCGCYLDTTLEAALSRAAKQTVAGRDILEVTCVASLRAGAAFRLIQGIVDIGRERGQSWGVFVATRRMRRILEAANLPLVDLGPAARERVERPDDWGTYYDNLPRVCALPDSAANPLVFAGNDTALKVPRPARFGTMAHA